MFQKNIRDPLEKLDAIKILQRVYMARGEATAGDTHNNIQPIATQREPQQLQALL